MLSIDNQICLMNLPLESDTVADSLSLHLGLAVFDRRRESRLRVRRDHQPNPTRAAAAENEHRLDHNKELEKPSTADQVKLIFHFFPEDWHIVILVRLLIRILWRSIYKVS